MMRSLLEARMHMPSSAADEDRRELAERDASRDQVRRREEGAQDADDDGRGLEEDREVVDDVEARRTPSRFVPHTTKHAGAGEEQPGDGQRREQPLVAPRQEEVDREDEQDQPGQDQLRQERDEVVDHRPSVSASPRQPEAGQAGAVDRLDDPVDRHGDHVEHRHRDRRRGRRPGRPAARARATRRGSCRAATATIGASSPTAR